MGFNFHRFVHKSVHSLKRVGSTVNRHFNTIKHHAKKHLPNVRYVAGLIRDAAKEWSTLPMVGQVASTIGQVADTVHRGTNVAERFFDQADRFQGGMGIDRSLRQ